ncbi:type I methionyl aminopeptidase [Thiomicrospira sp. ALE5]|uniref:type I methionyl aminopeptidase n=1 Tax=Thiomicrospira sp. ALE5 TaxID=748650 RepID=UPI0008E6FF83|nr:type I methionyl aminopeptidase [Thiomicrospira sp. ALE5]SFR48932.1 methionyl aminopeptidase [Thiomicrospira sp. ALE5]
MSIKLKSAEQQAKMRTAGRLAAEVLEYLTPFVKVGVTTEELNQLAHNYMIDVQDSVPATLGYHGYPKSICTSINHVVCHGIPNDKKLKKGDIINIDVTIIKDGFHGDTSKMFVLEGAKPFAHRICQVAYECLWKGIDQVKPNASLYDVAKAIEDHAHRADCSVVKDYCGHGIGEDFHESPQVLHYAAEELKDIILKPGMTFTIEPMVNLGKHEVKLLGDNWTVITKDRKLSAQWEHTLLVTPEGVEVLTLRQHEQRPSFN